MGQSHWENSEHLRTNLFLSLGLKQMHKISAKLNENVEQRGTDRHQTDASDFMIAL